MRAKAPLFPILATSLDRVSACLVLYKVDNLLTKANLEGGYIHNQDTAIPELDNQADAGEGRPKARCPCRGQHQQRNQCRHNNRRRKTRHTHPCHYCDEWALTEGGQHQGGTLCKQMQCRLYACKYMHGCCGT